MTAIRGLGSGGERSLAAAVSCGLFRSYAVGTSALATTYTAVSGGAFSFFFSHKIKKQKKEKKEKEKGKEEKE